MLHSDLVALPASFFFLFQGSRRFTFSLQASWGRKGTLVACALLTSFLARVGSEEPWAGCPPPFCYASAPWDHTHSQQGWRRRWVLRVLVMMFSKGPNISSAQELVEGQPSESERISSQSNPISSLKQLLWDAGRMKPLNQPWANPVWIMCVERYG